MEEFDDCAFYISFNSSALVDEEPDNYLITIDGKILCSDYGDEDRLIGKLRLFFVDLDEAAQDGFDPFYILDMKSETEPFSSALFDPKTTDFKKSVSRLAGNDIYSSNLLILDRLEILPEYRGRRLGLACLYRCIQQHWHGSGLVALKCFPLQFEVGSEQAADEWAQKMKTKELGEDQRGCRSKLENYYALLGFKRVGKSEFMILNPYHVRPGFEQLGFS